MSKIYKVEEIDAILAHFLGKWFTNTKALTGHANRPLLLRDACVEAFLRPNEFSEEFKTQLREVMQFLNERITSSMV